MDLNTYYYQQTFRSTLNQPKHKKLTLKALNVMTTLNDPNGQNVAATMVNDASLTATMRTAAAEVLLAARPLSAPPTDPPYRPRTF